MKKRLGKTYPDHFSSAQKKIRPIHPAAYWISLENKYRRLQECRLLKDSRRSRTQILEHIITTSGKQEEECTRQLEDLISIFPLAKSPRERTSMNIVLDDQRKVLKALKRLQNDALEILAGS